MNDDQTAFGLRLRAAREARGTSLRQIADATKLSVRILDALERGKMAFLPGGIYRRSIVRSYAREIGLDPESTLRDFLREYPDDLPPPAGPGESRTEAPASPPDKPARSWRSLAFRLGGLLTLASAVVGRSIVDR